EQLVVAAVAVDGVVPGVGVQHVAELVAVDRVGAVATRGPVHAVAAGQLVAAAAAAEGVVAGAAGEHVGLVGAVERVVAGAPVGVDDERAQAGRGGHGVGAAELEHVDPLHRPQVHGDVGHVALEEDPAAVGRDRELLVDVGAVEVQRVVAVAALVGVAAVTGIPGEVVGAGTPVGGVVAAVRVDQVVARVAVERLGAGAADERVVAVAAVDRGRDRVGEHPVAFVDGDPVVATAGVDLDLGEARDRKVLWSLTPSVA